MVKRPKLLTLVSTAIALGRSALIILTCLFIGKTLQTVANLPISGSIIGLLVLFFALISGIIRLDHVLPTGKLLLQYLVLFFVPVGVGLLNYIELLSQHWQAIVVSSVASTVIVLLVTGWLFQRFSK